MHLVLPMLELSKTLWYEFWYDCEAKNMVKKQSRVISVWAFSLYTEKQMIFVKKLQKMLKLDLILQILN